MEELKPPIPMAATEPRFSVFLAGSIEMGAAEDWQARVRRALGDLDILVLNPRRDTWDPSWPQRDDFEPFREQVEWELAAQEQADLIAFYFAPGTRAPITLLELGLAVAHDRRRRAVVCCPEGYWRRGNVDIVCLRYGLSRVETLDDLVRHIRAEAAAGARRGP